MARTKVTTDQLKVSAAPRPLVSLGEDVLTTPPTAGGTGTVLSGSLTVPSTLAGMTLELELYIYNCFGSVVNDYFNLVITVDGTVCGQGRIFITSTAFGTLGLTKCTGILQNVSAGSHSYSVTWTRSGSGTLTMEATATTPISLRKNLR